MTPGERLALAATQLLATSQLLGDDPLAASVAHLARAARARGHLLGATIHVELPVQARVRFTVRQTGDLVLLIDRETGEKRTASLLEFVTLGSVQAAWDAHDPR